METKHTPTPWTHVAGSDPRTKLIMQEPMTGLYGEASPRVYIARTDIETIEHLGDEYAAENSQANAAFIVTACNAYEIMLQALAKLANPDFDWSADCKGSMSYDEWVVFTAAKARGEA